MKNNSSENRFDQAAHGVCERLRSLLVKLPVQIKNDAQEIRLRAGKPVSVCCSKSTYFISQNGTPVCFLKEGLALSDRIDLEESFRNICCYSVYSHQHEIKNGYITMRGGHRAGICGTAVQNAGGVGGVRDISSINIRVARQIDGAADELFEKLGNKLNGGVLLAGPPSSGKTTLLRDMARQLAGGVRGDMKKVAVIDERGELAGTHQGFAQNDLGFCCDVLDGYPKGEGILQAIRSLSPEIIICDEMGGQADIAAVEEGLNAGVIMVASIHAGCIEELKRRKQAVRLLETGAFLNIVMLGDRSSPGKITGIYTAGEWDDQNSGACDSHTNGIGSGIFGVA